MLVKFIKPHFGYSYFPGDEAEIEEKVAESLIANQYVESVEEKTEKPEKPAKSKQK